MCAALQRVVTVVFTIVGFPGDFRIADRTKCGIRVQSGREADGRIVIGLTDEVNDNDAKMQVLYFEGAKFFSMSEQYDIDSSRRRLLKLSMVSESLQLENVKFKCL